jgi:hypothetical protein
VLRKLYTEKISSEDYKLKYKDTLSYFHFMIGELEDAALNNQLTQDITWYEVWLGKFLFSYQWVAKNQDPSMFSENFLRTYWGLAKLISSSESFPPSKF